MGFPVSTGPGPAAGLIYYRRGYKYQLMETFRVLVPELAGARAAIDDWISLERDGTLTIKYGYAWDGPSGPTIDTKNFMRGSVVHDAGYQLVREGLLPPEAKDALDLALHRICLEDGMSVLRAWYVLRGVRLGGAEAANPDSYHPTITAP